MTAVATADTPAESATRDRLLSDYATRIQQAVEEHLARRPFAISVEGANSAETSALLQRTQAALRAGPSRDEIAIGWFHPWMYDQPAEAAKAFGLAALGAFAAPDALTGQRWLQRLRFRFDRTSRSWVDDFRRWVMAQPWSDEMRVQLASMVKAQQRALIVIVDGLDRCDSAQQAGALRAALALADSAPAVLIVGDSWHRRTEATGALELLQSRLDDLTAARFMIPPEPLAVLQAQIAGLLASRPTLAALLVNVDKWSAALTDVFYPQGNRLRRFIRELDSELRDRAEELGARPEAERRSLAQQLAFLRVLGSLHAEVLRTLQERTDGAELLIRLQLYFSNPRDAAARLARWSSDPQFRQLAGQLPLATCFSRFTGGSPPLVHLLPVRLAAARFLTLDQSMPTPGSVAEPPFGDVGWMKRVLGELRENPQDASIPAGESERERKTRTLDKALAPARITGNFLLLTEVARQLDWSDADERALAEAVAREAKDLAMRVRDTSGILHSGLVLAGIYIAGSAPARARSEINSVTELQGLDELERLEIIRRSAALEDLEGNKQQAKVLWEQAADYAAGTQAPEEALRSIVNAALAHEELQHAGRSLPAQAKTEVAQALSAAVNRAAWQGSAHERPQLFVSYKHGEGECVLDSLRDLSGRGIDILSDLVLTSGGEWRGEIYAKLLAADAFLLVLGAKYLKSEECVFELKTACALRSANPQVRIFWVNLDGEGQHQQLREIQAMNHGQALMAQIGVIPSDKLRAITDEIAVTLVPPPPEPPVNVQPSGGSQVPPPPPAGTGTGAQTTPPANVMPPVSPVAADSTPGAASPA